MQTCLRSITHGDGYGAIQFDDRRRLDAQQQVVQADNFFPVSGFAAAGLRVDSSYGGLEGVGAEAAGREGTTDERSAFGDLPSVPERAILVVEENDFAVGRSTSCPAGFVKKHEGEQALGFRFRQEFEEQANEADGFGGKVVARQGSPGRSG